jgi:hypothetical protein
MGINKAKVSNYFYFFQGYKARYTALLSLVWFLGGAHTWAQPCVEVIYLHGSKPKKQYQGEEKKVFGGMIGGHFAIRLPNDQVMHFRKRTQKVHLLPHRRHRGGNFWYHTKETFSRIYALPLDQIKSTIWSIPIDSSQLVRLESIATQYQNKTPYDYAFFGMRCSSSVYEVLSQIDVLPHISRRWVAFRIFRPRHFFRIMNRQSKKMCGKQHEIKVRHAEFGQIGKRLQKIS